MTTRLALSFAGAELGWSHLWLFLLGIGVGALVMLLVYLVVLATSLKPPKIKVKVDKDAFPPEALNALVKEKHNKFNEKCTKRAVGVQIAACKDVIGETVSDIAAKFYPKSKYPMLELNVSEVLVLNKQVTERLEDIFNKPVIRWLRKVKVSHVMGVYDLKKKLDENEPLQKILDFGKEAHGIYKILRWNKPTTWVGFGVGKLIELVSSKVCLIAISYVAEESYKIYSKKFMDDEIAVDTEAAKLLDGVKDVTGEIEAPDKDGAKV